jgi:hypothetical protein
MKSQAQPSDEEAELDPSDPSDTSEFDEVIGGPGYFIARKGRFLVQHHAFDPTQHKAMQANLVAQMPTLLEELRGKISQLEQIIIRYHPLDLLGNLSFANSIIDAESYKEYEFKGSSAYLEYVALLYLLQPVDSLAWTTDVIPDGTVLEQIQSLLDDIYRIEMMLLITQHVEDADGKTPDVWDELRFKTISDSLRVRYPGYQHHLVQHLQTLAQAADAVIGEFLGWTISDALALAQAVPALTSKRLVEKRKAAIDRVAELREVIAGSEEKGFRPPTEMAELLEQLKAVSEESLDTVLENYAMAATFVGLGDEFSFSAGELGTEAGISQQKAEAFLSHLSLSFGSTIEDRYRRPAPTHPLALRPFLRHGDRYFCPVPQMIEWSLRPAIEAFLKPESPDRTTKDPRFWNKYEGARSSFLETKAMELLGRALASAKVYTNLKYSTLRNDDAPIEAELDGLVLLDNVVIFVECKAGSLSLPARRGAPRGMKEDMRELVEKAYSQCLRAKQYFERAARPTFKLENGTKVEIDKANVDRLVLIVVTLDALDAFTTNAYRLQDAGFFGAGNIPWIVSLADLQVICELIECPSQLVHYLERRKRLNELAKTIAHDELDWFGHYLLEGLFFDEVFAEDRGPDLMQLLSYTTAIDDYYMYETGQRQTPAEKPRQQMPEMLRTFLMSIDEHHPPGHVEAVCAFLDMSSESRTEFVAMLESLVAATQGDGRLHDLTVPFPSSSTGITCMAAPQKRAHEVERKLAPYCGLKKYQMKYERWIGLAVLVDVPGMVHGLICMKGAWEFDPVLEEFAIKFLRPLPTPETEDAS